MARAGFGSRRQCEDLIGAGRVSVDGRRIHLGDRADPTQQVISVDDVKVRFPEFSVAYLLNKPLGVVTTARDPQRRPTVVELVPTDPRVFPVGRLDRDTEGLLILTNDGDFAQQVTHPSHGLEKTYVATVNGRVDAATTRRLQQGVSLEDGPAEARGARVLGVSGGTSLVELRIAMGRKRVVRRMLAEVGHPVQRLVRTAIGPLRDERLEPGAWRRLATTEIAAIEKAAKR